MRSPTRSEAVLSAQNSDRLVLVKPQAPALPVDTGWKRQITSNFHPERAVMQEADDDHYDEDNDDCA